MKILDLTVSACQYWAPLSKKTVSVLIRLCTALLRGCRLNAVIPKLLCVDRSAALYLILSFLNVRRHDKNTEIQGIRVLRKFSSRVSRLKMNTLTTSFTSHVRATGYKLPKKQGTVMPQFTKQLRGKEKYTVYRGKR